jgi:hypothetical protein
MWVSESLSAVDESIPPRETLRNLDPASNK